MPEDHIGANVQRGENIPPSDGVQSAATASIQNTGDAKLISSVTLEPTGSDQLTKKKMKKKGRRKASDPISKPAANAPTSTPVTTKKAKKDQKGVNRATALRKQYPTMKNIPNSITPAQRKKLILHHSQNATNRLQPPHTTIPQGPADTVPTSTTQSKKSTGVTAQEKQRNRAASLKQQYPKMEGIPPKVGKGTRKKLIDQYKARSSALAPTSSNITARSGTHLTELPQRPVPAASISGMRSRHSDIRLHADSSGYPNPTSQRPTSNKMAPLSAERLAEVTRNLAAGSNDDPVMID